MPAYASETDLLNALKRGESAAFRQLYTAHYGMIRFFVIQNSGREEEAADLFQDALVVLYEKLNSETFVLTASLKTFLYSVCRNLWLKKLSKDRTVPLTDFEPADEAFDFSEAEEDENKKALLRRSVAQLGESCRRLLLLFYYFKKSMQEISTELGYTNADNAKNQKYKCLQRLKTIYHTVHKEG